MSLARVWRRRLYGASTAALIVPSAMLAALLVLALGGGFSQVGVLGQIFAGPPALGAGAHSGGGGGVAPGLARSLPVIPGVAVAIGHRRPSGRVIGAGGPSGVSNRTRSAGAAPIGTGAPIRLTPRPGPGSPSRPVPTQTPAPGTGTGTGTAPGPGSGSHPPSPSPSPEPTPPPQPTVVDKVVTVVTQVTQPLPAPVGPAATQAVQAAGSAADGVLPPAPPGTLR